MTLDSLLQLHKETVLLIFLLTNEIRLLYALMKVYQGIVWWNIVAGPLTRSCKLLIQNVACTSHSGLRTNGAVTLCTDG